MTTTDLEIVKNSFDIIELLKIVIPFLIGGASGVYVENRWSIKNTIKSKIVSKTKIIKKTITIHFLSGWFSGRFNKDSQQSPEGDFRQELLTEPVKSPLTPSQIGLCKQVKEITSIHCNEFFDPRKLYEAAVKEKNSNGAESATLPYFQLFNKISKLLQGIAVEKNANREIGNLINVVEGLRIMLDEPIDLEKLKRQFNSCEKATIAVLAIVYDPN